MERLQKLQTTILTPTTIDDDGGLLIKQLRTSGMETNTAINKIMKNMKANNETIDGRLVELEEKTLAMTDLTDTNISAPSSLQILQYGSGKWSNQTPPPKTVSFCFVYPTTNQYSPFYKFKSNKKIIAIDISAIVAPSAPMIFRLKRSDGWDRFSTYFSGQNSHWDVNIDVSENELYYSFIEGPANGINLANFELTVVDR